MTNKIEVIELPDDPSHRDLTDAETVELLRLAGNDPVLARFLLTDPVCGDCWSKMSAEEKPQAALALLKMAREREEKETGG